MSGAIWAKGTQFKRGNAATPEVFTAIAEIVTLSGPPLARDMEDVTNHDSTAGWEEALPTVLRSGSISLELNYQPAIATHAQLVDDLESGTAHNYQLIFSDVGLTTWTLRCFMESVSIEAPAAGKLACTVTLKITGQPTLV